MYNENAEVLLEIKNLKKYFDVSKGFLKNRDNEFKQRYRDNTK